MRTRTPRWSSHPCIYHDAWVRARKTAGLHGKLIHDPRRTAVRRMERTGVLRSVPMALSGHRTESIYRRYAIVSESDLAAGVDRIAGASGSITAASDDDAGTDAAR